MLEYLQRDLLRSTLCVALCRAGVYLTLQHWTNCMESDQPTTGRTRGPAPLTTAVRQRLQKLFEHAQRCLEKDDHDYANQLFTQCVVEDPDNLIYLQFFLTNLQKKYSDNKKGGKLAGLKI